MSNQFVAGIRNVQLLYIPSQLPVERQGKVFQSHTDSYGSNNLHFRMLQHNECMGLVCMYVCVYFPTSAGAPRVGQAQLTWVASHIPMVYPHTHTHTHCACHLKMRGNRKIDHLMQGRRSMVIDYYWTVSNVSCKPTTPSITPH